MPKWKPIPKTLSGDGQLARRGFFVYLLYFNLCLWSTPGEAKEDPPRFYAEPNLLKSYLFPHNNRTVGAMIEVTPDMIIDGLLTLERMRYIRFYKIEREDYLLMLKHIVELKPTGPPELPGPGPGYKKDRYIPTFAGHTDELPFEGDPGPDAEPPDDEEPPTAATNNECCLTDNASKYGLNAKGFNKAIGPYCEVRRRRAWCFKRDYCDKAIMAVIKRIKKQKTTIRDYPSYLMSALQEHLIEDADTIKPPGAPYSTGPGGGA